ncbi:hypothetical protein ACFPYI_00385 [Halomarina salina]|uniref:DUF7847 domain-containing protein n=1 Tax=Halomarina salina TaxID=1872699 RepID=A0ABD5RGS2_9EURY|nr:hypothetical protein [Halomarina salina]
MSIQVLDTAERGIRRAVTRNGLVLMAVLFVIGLATALVDLGLDRLVVFDPADPAAVEFVAPTLGASLLSLALSVLGMVVVIGATRILVSDETETLPREAFTHRMGWAWLNVFVGTIVFAILVAFGFVALIVPGFFLLVALAFWTVFVAVEDQSFVAGMRSSWALTRGNRLSLFVLGLLMFVVGIGIGIAFGIVGFVGGTIALVLGQAASAISTVFGLAVLATAYNTLRATDDEESPEAPAADPQTPGSGATGGI